MTDTYPAMCASSHYYKQADVIIRARALLALAEPVIPVKQQIFPTPSQAAECGGPCYAGGYCPEACDCGLYQPPALAAEGPTDEDLEDLADVMNVSGNPVPAMRRALELWGRPTPQLVAVAERPWEREGRCWLRGKVEGDWRLLHPEKSGLPQLKYCFTHSLPAHSLPAHALPTPETTNG